MNAKRLIVCLLTGLPALAGPPRPARFYALGDLPGGPFISFASDVSYDGSVVVGLSAVAGSSFGTFNAFIWTEEEGMQPLHDPSAFGSSGASAVSEDGQYVVGGTGRFAFIWSRTDGLQVLGDIPGGVERSDGLAVSACGPIVVGQGSLDCAVIDPPNHAFRWTPEGGMQALGSLVPDNCISCALAIASDVDMTVGYSMSPSGGLDAVYWLGTDGPFSFGLQSLSVYTSEAKEISADGTVVMGTGSESDLGFILWRWTAAKGIELIYDPTFRVWLPTITGLSADGSVAVGISSGSTPIWIWDEQHGFRNLRRILRRVYNLPPDGYRILSVQGISGDGRTIIGDMLNPDQNTEAYAIFLGDPVGCPGDIDLDGQITLGDLSRLLTNLGTPGGATFADGDIDGDGDVDATDLSRMLSAFGSACL